MVTFSRLGQFEHGGRLGLADPVALAEVEVDGDPHQPGPPGPAAGLAPVADHAGLLELDHHLRVVVAVGVRGLGQLELPVRQQHREDGLELHHGEGGPDAPVAAGPEGDPGPGVGPVLLARLEVAGRLEGVGVGEVLGDPVGDRRAGPDHLAGLDGEPVHLEVLLGHPEQQDERRVQAQGLLDGRLEVGHLPEGLVADLGAVGVELDELAVHRGQLVGMAEQLDEGPGRGARRGVVAGEHHGDEHAGHLVGQEARRAVLVADGHEDVEQVALVVVGRGSLRPVVP